MKESKDKKEFSEAIKKAIADSGGKVLSFEDSYIQRQIEDTLKKSLPRLLKIFVGPIFVVLILLVVRHLYFVNDSVKLLNFVALYLGLSGVFLVSYGHLSHLKGLWKRKTFSSLRPDKDPFENTKIIYEILRDYIDTQAKVEIIKQVSLFIGFVLIFISFAIQLYLQF